METLPATEENEYFDGQQWVEGNLPAPLAPETDNSESEPTKTQDRNEEIVIPELEPGAPKPRHALLVYANGFWATGVYDTGSEGTLVDRAFVQQYLQDVEVKESKIRIKPIGEDNEIPSDGSITLKLALGNAPGKVFQIHTCQILPGLGCNFIIGRSFIEQLKQRCQEVIIDETKLQLSYKNPNDEEVVIKLWPWRGQNHHGLKAKKKIANTTCRDHKMVKCGE
jgi:hypothetical protein